MSEFYLVINILLTHARTLIVISGTNPIFNMFSLGFLKNKVDFKWLLFGYDIFPENLIPGGVVSSSNCIYKISKVIFSRLYSSPDEIVAVGRDMKNLLLKKPTIDYLFIIFLIGQIIMILSLFHYLKLVQNQRRLLFSFLGI